MAIDKGGLQYSINIEGNFAARLQEFRAQLGSAREAWVDFRRQIGRVATAATSASRAAQSLSRESQRLATSTRRSNAETSKAARGYNRTAEALQSYERQLERAAVARQREVLAIRNATVAARRSLVNQRAELRASRDVAAALEQQAVARRRAQLAAEAGIKLSADGRRVFDAEAEALRQLAVQEERRAIAAEKARIVQERARAQGPVFGPEFGPEAQRNARAQERLRREKEALLDKQATDRLKAQDREYQALVGSTDQVTRSTRRMNREFEKTESRANRIAFTFRRLFGILAAFTIARQVVQQFNNMLRSAVGFNATIEQTELGFAGLVVAAGRVVDQFGNVVEGEEAFLAAQRIARSELRALQGDAQNTAATFEQLSRAFTTAVAPGLQAGLTLKQIRAFTIQISQAASGLGVAQDQLAEEIRSLLQGTITARTTRIATALGISNADIRRARELGDLYGFLEKRFEGISRAGQDLIKTFNAEVTNTADAFQRLAGAASTGFFEELTGLFRDLKNALQVEIDDAIEVDPNAAAAVQELFDGLQTGVEGIRAALGQILSSDIGAFFGIIGEAIGGAANALARAVAIIVDVTGPTVRVFAELFSIVNRVATAIGNLTLGLLENQVIRAVAQFTFLVAILNRVLRLQLLLGVAVKAYVAAISAASFLIDAIVGKQTILNALTTRWGVILKRAILPLTAVLALLAALDSVLDGAVSGFLSDAFAEVESFISRILGLEETIAATTESGVNRVISNLAALNSEAQSLIEKLDRDLRLATDNVRDLGPLIGIDPGVAGQLTQFFNTLNQSNERAITLRRRFTELRNEAVGLEEAVTEKAKERAEQEERVRELAQDQYDLKIAAEKLDAKKIAAENRLLLLTGRRFEEIQRIQAAELGRRAAGQAGPETEAISLNEEQVFAFRQVRDLLREQSALTAKIGENERAHTEAVREVEALDKQVVASQGLIADAKLQQKQIAENLLDVEREALALAAKRIELSARQATFDNRREILATRLATTFERLQNQAGRDEGQLAIVRQARQIAEDELEFAFRRQEVEGAVVRLKEVQTELSRDAVRNASAIAEVSQQIQSLEQLGYDLDLKRTAEKERQLELLRRLKIAESSDFGAGLEEGFRQFTEEAPEFGEIGINLAKSLSEGFATLGATAITNTIAAAIDPNQSTSIREAVGSLALSLGQSLLEQLIQSLTADALQSIFEFGVGAGDAAVDASKKLVEGASESAKIITEAAQAPVLISSAAAAGAELLVGAQLAGTALVAFATQAAAILAAAGGAGAAAGQPPLLGPGFAEGGRIRNHFSPPSPFHYSAPGFARGGRPKKDPRDTIPIWARPGEWVIRPESVKLYGDKIMSLINSGMLDPELLNRLSSEGKRAIEMMKAWLFASKRTSIRGFASGGEVGGHPRPAGLDRRDTVPIWARPGEWVIRPEAVALYGNKVMQMLNSGLISPEILRQLSSANRSIRKGSKGPGFAEGGQVNQTKGSTRGSVSSTETVLIQPVTFSDEQSLDQALAAGPKSFARHARKNSNELKAALNN